MSTIPFSPTPFISSKSYKRLTPKAKSFLNGCGPEWFLILPGQKRICKWMQCSLFSECCRIHDFDYSFDQVPGGGNEDHRCAADEAFLVNMQMVVRAQKPWWKRLRASILAQIFYRSVRHLGKSYYTYGPRPSLLEVI